jgi:hypothetical protein
VRFLPTRVHGGLDYALGLALMAVSYVARAQDGAAMRWIPALLGFGLILYSLVTDYELGALRLLPLRAHLALDAAGGLVLIGLAAAGAHSMRNWLPMGVLGLLEIGSSLCTQTTTSDGPGLQRAPVLASSAASRSMPAADGPRTPDGRPRSSPAMAGTEDPERLRRRIDSGQTGDKIAMTDPAAAPLGSDDEAAELHDERGLAVARRQTGKA